MTSVRNPALDGLETDEPGQTLESALPSNAQQLAAYLHDRLETEGECYVKSKFIAEDIDLSSKQIGAYLKRLEAQETNVSVEQWGYANATTWRVTLE